MDSSKRKRRFEGLIFDAGDVLFDASVWRRWLTERLRNLGVKITYEGLVEKWERLLVDVYRGQAEYWDRFRQLLDSLGLSGSEAAKLITAGRVRAKEVQVGRKPFEGVLETLTALKKAGVKLCVLSDSENTEKRAREMLNSLGLEHYFDAVITSKDISHVKPEQQAYQAAADALGVELSLCGFVGHDSDELAGAGSVGMFTIAFNPEHQVEADVHIKHFSELNSISAE